MDFLDEDEKEAEKEPSEEDLVVPVISNTSAIRRCRLREDRRQAACKSGRSCVARSSLTDISRFLSTSFWVVGRGSVGLAAGFSATCWPFWATFWVSGSWVKNEGGGLLDAADSHLLRCSVRFSSGFLNGDHASL